mgnify:FL=1
MTASAPTGDEPTVRRVEAHAGDLLVSQGAPDKLLMAVLILNHLDSRTQAPDAHCRLDITADNLYP